MHSHHQPNTPSHSKFFLFIFTTFYIAVLKTAELWIKLHAITKQNNCETILFPCFMIYKVAAIRNLTELHLKWFSLHTCAWSKGICGPSFLLGPSFVLCRSQLTALLSLHLMENPSADLGGMNVQHYLRNRGSDGPKIATTFRCILTCSLKNHQVLWQNWLVWARRTWGWVYLCHQIASPQIRAQINATRSSRWRCVCCYLSFKAFMSQALKLK